MSANLAIGGKAATPVLILGAAGVVLFTFGGIVGLIGLTSGKVEWPGEKPSWWGRNGDKAITDLDKNGAQYWLAGHYEIVISAIAKLNRRRATILHIALGLGGLGSVCIAAAACASIFVRPPPDGSPPVGANLSPAASAMTPVPHTVLQSLATAPAATNSVVRPGDIG